MLLVKNLSIPNKIINSLPSFLPTFSTYKDTIDSWCQYYSYPPELPSLVSLQFLWYNSYIEN